jgi:hypothetical protein
MWHTKTEGTRTHPGYIANGRQCSRRGLERRGQNTPTEVQRAPIGTTVLAPGTRQRTILTSRPDTDVSGTELNGSRELPITRYVWMPCSQRRLITNAD